MIALVITTEFNRPTNKEPSVQTPIIDCAQLTLGTRPEALDWWDSCSSTDSPTSKPPLVAPSIDWQPSPGSYSGFDLDCSDFGSDIWVGQWDPHGLDRDGDGIGCE